MRVRILNTFIVKYMLNRIHFRDSVVNELCETDNNVPTKPGRKSGELQNPIRQIPNTCPKAGGTALSIMGLMFSLIYHLEDRNDVNNLYTIPQR